MNRVPRLVNRELLGRSLKPSMRYQLDSPVKMNLGQESIGQESIGQESFWSFRLKFFDVIIILLAILTCVELYERYQRRKKTRKEQPGTSHGILDIIYDYIYDRRDYYHHNLEGLEKDYI